MRNILQNKFAYLDFLTYLCTNKNKTTMEEVKLTITLNAKEGFVADALREIATAIEYSESEDYGMTLKGPMYNAKVEED